MERAWARRERRWADCLAVVAYCAAAAAGSKVTLDDVRGMMPKPNDPDEQDDG